MLRWPSIAASIAQFIGAAIAAASIGQWAGAQNGIPCRYEISHVIQGPYCGGFGYPPTFGTGISPNGRYVCGYYNVCTIGNARAFVYDTQAQQFTGLPHPQGVTVSYAWDVSDAGKVVGRIGGSNGDYGYIYNVATGQYTLLPAAVPSDGTCTVTAINSSGVVCGRRTVQLEPLRFTAFTWSEADGFQDLGLMNGLTTAAEDIAEDGTFAGRYGNNANARAIVHSDGSTQELPVVPGGFSSACIGLNDLGQACGYGLYPDPSGNVTRAFLWADETMVNLGVLPGMLRSFAQDVNNDSIVVGYCRTMGTWDLFTGYVWHNGVMRDLNSLLSENSEYYVSSGDAISVGGSIAGSALDQEGNNVAIVLSPTPAIGDATGDCVVNVSDLLMVINEWGKGRSPADLNADGIVNVADLLIVVSNWT